MILYSNMKKFKEDNAMKKVLSYLMAIALIVTSISFVGTDKVSAHQKYTTKGLVIDTSLVPPGF